MSSRLPRKVLHVLNSASGGAALSTIALIEELRKHGIESSAVCHDAGTGEERDALRESVRGEVLFTPLYWWNRKIRAATWKRPLLELRQLAKTRALIGSSLRVAGFVRRTRAELIHTNTILTPEGALTAMAMGLPHVWHLRELVGPGNPFRFVVEGERFGRHLARMASVIVANSNASARAIASWLPDGALEVVPNAIDVTKFARGAPSADRIVVAMVASLSSRTKNHALFIDAAASVNAPHTVFRIYGHVPDDDSYVAPLRERIARFGLPPRFELAGFKAAPEVMKEIDILVHPADNESFGRVVVEAMAAGLPVVGVRAGGIAEIVEHERSGFLATPGDATEIARFIERLANSSELRERLGARGRERARERYSLEAMGRSMVGVYARALQEPMGVASHR